MTPQVLTTRALNRSLLARQLLLERASMTLPRALEQVAGLQTQYAPSGYIGLWSRVAGFERSALTSALERGRVVQATLMRGTIHMVSARDFVPFAAAIRDARRKWWLRQNASFTADDMDSLTAVLRRLLADGPRRAPDLIRELAAEGFDKRAWGGAGFWTDMVRVPPSGTWDRRRADLYGFAEQQPEIDATDRAKAIGHLLVRYLRGFGPAALADAANWAGLALTDVRDAADRARLRRLRNSEGEELFDVPRGPLPPAGAPAPVRFLPTWDAILLAHARRADILPARFRPLVFSTKQPQSVATFLVDGSVAGSWRYDGGAMTVTPFERLTARLQREVDAEAERIAGFLR